MPLPASNSLAWTSAADSFRCLCSVRRLSVARPICRFGSIVSSPDWTRLHTRPVIRCSTCGPQERRQVTHRWENTIGGDVDEGRVRSRHEINPGLSRTGIPAFVYATLRRIRPCPLLAQVEDQ